MEENLDIFLLGGMQIIRGGELLTDFMSAKVAALFVYLALTNRPHPRAALAGLLWGEMSEEDAHNNLRQALSNLRKKVSPYLTITRETVQFESSRPCWIDVHQFEMLAQVSPAVGREARLERLQQARLLYQGEFLAGFYVRDAPHFEEWLMAQRARYHELAVSSLHDLAEGYLERRQYAQAMDIATQLIALDRWREEAHQVLMLALARSGRRSAALAQYKSLVRFLEKELGVSPSLETIALYNRLAAGRRCSPPVPISPLVGRAGELEEIHVCLADAACRLVTLTGLPGIGKTSLAMQVAHESSQFINGVCFVSLETIHRAELIPAAVYTALRLPAASLADQKRRLLDYLREKELLLVLDNCEHLVKGAGVIAEILSAAPLVKILATSRQRLSLVNEVVYQLEGLAYPETGGSQAPLLEYEAVQLFMERARQSKHDFILQEQDERHVARICQLLQGLPLGIKLAASWVHAMSCAQIAEELVQALDILESPRQDVGERQRSLKATFEHSWLLLSEEEQRTFRRLGIFPGSFSLAAATQVSGGTPRMLFALVEKSLLFLDRNGRYTFHPLLRQYVLGKLANFPDEQRAARQQHAKYFTEVLEVQGKRLFSSAQKEALAVIDSELENLRHAWRWLVEERQVELIQRALDGFYHFAAIRSRFQEGYELFEAVRQALERSSSMDVLTRLVYYRATARAGRFLSYLSRYAEARRMLLESLEAFRELGVKDEMAFALSHLGSTCRMQGDFRLAREYLGECLALRLETDHRIGQAVVFLELAGVDFVAGEYPTAREHCHKGLGIVEGSGDLQTFAHLLTGLSLIERELGNYDLALSYGQQGLEIYEALDDRYGMIQSALTLGELSRQMTHYEKANQSFQLAFQISSEIGDRSSTAEAAYRMGQIAAALKEHRQALRHYANAMQIVLAIQDALLIGDCLVAIAELWFSEQRYAESAALLQGLLRADHLSDSNHQQVNHLLVAVSGEYWTGEEAKQDLFCSGESLEELAAAVMVQLKAALRPMAAPATAATLPR